MIESITIANVATYDGSPETLGELRRINFIFGSNGAGKSTIGRIIADEASYPSCRIAWKGGTKLQPMVYNHDFVERNFNKSTELKGVFTLGEKQKETLEKISSAKSEANSITARIEGLNHALNGQDGISGKKGELQALEARLTDKCWAKKKKYDATLQGAFEGYRGSAEKFKSKILQEEESNSSSLEKLSDLEKKAASLFGKTPAPEIAIPSIDIEKIIRHASNPILKKKVIGKSDVDIAAMITKLGNSDWVRQGMSFYDANDMSCPFCQQSTTEAFAKSLSEYFDETYLEDSSSIDDLATNYDTDSSRLQQQILQVISGSSKFLDVERLKIEKEILDSKISVNKQKIAGKKKEASQTIELESLSNVLSEVKSLIDAANHLVTEHNKVVANLSNERASLTAQVWRYVLEELKAEIDEYKKSRDSLNGAVDLITSKIHTASAELVAKNLEIRALEKKTTSVQPTVDGINSILSSFGFQGFKLSTATDGVSYKLVRSDGSDAKNTLSEGEKTFVTFLYFYHLLKGSNSDNGITTDRVVVFDDPVSSLDSDILFIVGSLIKGLFDEVRTAHGHIKQVYVLTHNVYFHKEVSFNQKRKDVALSDETFWVVRKSGVNSKLDKHPTNPIKTSYELLWSEVRRNDRSSLTIQNTLRRILENYFKILGGVNPDEICMEFEGRERLICKSLFSWVNDGSHFAHDDMYFSIDQASVDTYLNIFKAIFEKRGHINHYKMMMGDDYAEPIPVAEEAAS
jgi:wobble nucleotide-excising tRNase